MVLSSFKSALRLSIENTNVHVTGFHLPPVSRSYTLFQGLPNFVPHLTVVSTFGSPQTMKEIIANLDTIARVWYMLGPKKDQGPNWTRTKFGHKLAEIGTGLFWFGLGPPHFSLAQD
ncbi:hypothetical protein BU15DRAFT_65527 [Melanogaster broomeanus]|nr:hypothetical protein BU15DRAFT_65527 [Melanogaster broomeanus]